MDPTSTLVVRERREGKEFVTRRIAGETIVVPVSARVGDLDAIYTLNEVASTIWQLLEEPTSVDRIVEIVCCEYDGVPADARQDVVELLESLEAEGLISQSPKPKA